MIAVIGKLAGAFGFWLACLVFVIPLCVAAALLEAGSRISRAVRERREKSRVSREMREFERAMRGGEK